MYGAGCPRAASAVPTTSTPATPAASAASPARLSQPEGQRVDLPGLAEMLTGNSVEPEAAPPDTVHVCRAPLPVYRASAGSELLASRRPASHQNATSSGPVGARATGGTHNATSV